MTESRIEQHPEYPLQPGREEQLASRRAAFLDAPKPGGIPDGYLREFIVLVHRFAFLEKLIQGEIRYQLPVHVDVMTLEQILEPEDEGEILAGRERGLLEWTTGAASELLDALDTIGIKVFVAGEQTQSTSEEPSPHAAEGAALASSEDILQLVRKGLPNNGGPTGAENLFGAFYFDGPTGPSILVGTSREHPEAAFIAAHEFAHLVADVNPYAPRFCSWDPRTLENVSQTPEEKRADRFARALLLPPVAMKAILSQVLKEPGGRDSMWDQLTAFFEVPTPVLKRRLADLGLPVPPAASSAGETPGSPPASLPAEESLALPERYVNLALAAYTEWVLEADTLARFLRTTEEEAKRVLAWAGIPRRKQRAEAPED